MAEFFKGGTRSYTAVRKYLLHQKLSQFESFILLGPDGISLGSES